MPSFVVNATRLRLRSAPTTATGNVVATLPHGHEVEVTDDGASEWWRVKTALEARVFEGFVAARYLSPKAEVPGPLVASAVTAVHLAARPPSRRDSARARFCPLIESLPTRSASAAPNERVAALYAIIDALAVEQSLRYRPTESSTYCNIYAFDYCFLAGAYLPRVWWKEKALIELSKGQAVEAAYDKTVRELGANSLHDWLIDWGDDFGWKRTIDLSELQSHVNAGRVGVICAKRKDPQRSGHITCVVPEAPGHGAERAGQAVRAPLQTQAGLRNKKLFSSAWWVERQREYSDTGFFFCD